MSKRSVAFPFRLAVCLVGYTVMVASCSDDPFPFFYPGDVTLDGSGASGDASGDATETDVSNDVDRDVAIDAADGGDDVTPDVGPECRDSLECEGGEVCNDAGVCVTFCLEDDDCSGDTPLCETLGGECVQCLAESNCGPDERCSDAFVCVPLCEDDDDCDGESTCDAGVCVEPETICTPGESGCDGNAVALCNSDGTAIDLEPCLDGTLCVIEGGSGTCIESECEPGSGGCVDERTSWFCDEFSGYTELACGSDERCEAGACKFVEGDRCVEASHESLNFGSVLAGTALAEAFTVNNCGDTEVTVTSVSILSGDFFDISSAPSPPIFLGEERFEVRFSPDESGVFRDTVTLTFADGSSLSVDVVGTGVSDTPGPMPSMRTELTWSTASDLDNHLLREGGSFGVSPFDCFYGNMNPEWGEPGGDDNPSMDTDDTDGFGPENISISSVEAGVVYASAGFANNINGGAGDATMRLYIDGDLEREWVHRIRTGTDVWNVFEIIFDADGSFEITSIDTATSDP